VYVGAQGAPILDSGTAIEIPASATTGPVDAVCVDSQGDTAVYADAVSYGVDPVGFSANLLPPGGDPTALLFGFGFGGDSFEIPAVNVGGAAATNVSRLQDLQPGILEGLMMQIPNGNSGEKPAISVSSSLGSGALSMSATYYASPTIVPGSGLLQLLYDAHRDLLYALKPTEVDILYPGTLEWQSPITFPPTATGTYTIMALSPDGSKLVVAGLSGQSAQLIVLDPSGNSPPAVVTYSGNSFDLSGSIAITPTNQVILAGSQAVALDLASLTFTQLNVDTGTLIRATPDGTHIFGLGLQFAAFGSIDPLTFSVQQSAGGFGDFGVADLAVSPDGSQFASVYVAPYGSGDATTFFDAGLHWLNENVYPDFSPPDDSGAIGSEYSPGGKVLVVPLGDSIEFWDTARGTLRARLMTPEKLLTLVYPEARGVPPTLALDSTGQTIYAISTSGLTVIGLPQPLDDMPSMQWPQARRGRTAHSALKGSIAARMATMRSKSRN
jgi:hypothetical protein